MSSFANSADLPELLRDSRLQADFHAEGQRYFTIHSRGQGTRASRNQEVWVHVKDLDSGGQSSVALQAQESPKSLRGPKYRAVKRIRFPESYMEGKKDLLRRELEAIIKFSQMRYGHLFVRTYGWYTSQSSLYIAMEYCARGDLQHYLSDRQKCPTGRIPEREVCDISFQVLEALLAMHEEDYSHRDLKPANILIESHPPDRWAVKLADFGLSRRVPNTAASLTSVRGTPRFMPPELLGFGSGPPGTANLQAVDMWCFGETLFGLLTGRGIFSSIADLSRFILGQIVFPSNALVDLNISPQAINYISSLVVSEPHKRMTAQGASSHPWMTASVEAHYEPSVLEVASAVERSPLEVAVIAHDSEASARWSDVLPSDDREPSLHGYGRGTGPISGPDPANRSRLPLTINTGDAHHRWSDSAQHAAWGANHDLLYLGANLQIASPLSWYAPSSFDSPGIDRASFMECNGSNDSTSSNRSTESNLERRSSRQILENSRRDTAKPQESDSSNPLASKKKSKALPGNNKAPYQRYAAAAPRVFCTECHENPSGFRGDHELQRHVNAKHAGQVTKYICRNPADVRLVSKVQPKIPLKGCSSCDRRKQYSAYCNAAAHLRRAHFHSGERRGGKAGGNWPLMEDLKIWYEKIKVPIGRAGVPP